MRSIAILLVAGLALSGCARSLSPDVYSRGEVGAKVEVENATVVAVRDVSIEGTKSNIGAGAGAVAGGVGGAVAVGRNRGAATLGAVAGAIIGAIAGAAIEEAATSSDGVEYMVRLENGETVAVVQPKGDAPLAPGDRALLVYGDHIRVVPAPAALAPAEPVPPPAAKDTEAPSTAPSPRAAEA
ncbi:MAG: hypothetical protein RIM80_17210 [Alphaproteobacteria bacterium]